VARFLYNGFRDSTLTTTQGASRLSVHKVRTGITTRGVLLDVPGALGVPWLEAGQPVSPADLDAAEERQGVTVREGDALPLYTGNAARAAHGIGDPPATSAGSGRPASRGCTSEASR
jgi:Putative cyclase